MCCAGAKLLVSCCGLWLASLTPCLPPLPPTLSAALLQELPVWTSAAVETEAEELQQLVNSLGLPAWSLALSILLIDAKRVQAFKKASPTVGGCHFQTNLCAG